MKRIAVVTSGGDAPGMNACVRAVVREGADEGLDVFGVRRAYAGLLEGDIIPLNARSVGGVLRQGGTFLRTARCEEFKTPQGVRRGMDALQEHGIDALVVCGGDGSLRGANELLKLGFPCIGLPGTIDNDLIGTDLAIGVDTALNTALDAIDKIKDTAAAMGRVFVVEVMGRHCGYLALMAGVAGGAELVLVPEAPVSVEEVLDALDEQRQRGKPHFIAVVAEGATPKARDLVDEIEASTERGDLHARLTVIGHVQRGGSPTAADRLLASRLGSEAVLRLKEGVTGEMVGLIGGQVAFTPIPEVVETPRPLDVEFYELSKVLAL
jgi:6-phosphofructokinase 1